MNNRNTNKQDALQNKINEINIVKDVLNKILSQLSFGLTYF